MKVALITPASRMVRNLHLGITSIASFLNEHSDHDAVIIDYTFHLDEWRTYLGNKLREHRPDIIAITCQMPYYQYVVRIMEFLRAEQFPQPVFLGGFHPSIRQEETLAETGVTGIVVGDGEETMRDILDAFAAGRELEGIAGLLYKRPDGEVVTNPPRPFFDVNKYDYFYDWTLWDDLDKFLTIFDFLPFVCTRGCVSNCSFCDVHQIKRNVAGSYYRPGDPEFYVRHIKHQWEMHRHRGFHHAWLYEVVFPFDLEWARRFCDAYRAAGLHEVLPFSIFSMASQLDEEKVRLLAETNCRSVRIGMETWSDDIRANLLNKPVTNENIRTAVRLCRQYGIAVTGYFILGVPGETHASIMKTFRFAWSLGIERPTFLVYKPFPGSDLLKKLHEVGGWVHDDLWHKSYFTAIGSLVSTPHLSPAQVGRYFFVFRLLSMLRIVWRQLRRGNWGFFWRYPGFLVRGVKTGLSPYWVSYWYFNRLENN